MFNLDTKSTIILTTLIFGLLETLCLMASDFEFNRALLDTIIIYFPRLAVRLAAYHHNRGEEGRGLYWAKNFAATFAAALITYTMYQNNILLAGLILFLVICPLWTLFMSRGTFFALLEMDIELLRQVLYQRAAENHGEVVQLPAEWTSYRTAYFGVHPLWNEVLKFQGKDASDLVTSEYFQMKMHARMFYLLAAKELGVKKSSLKLRVIGPLRCAD